MGFLDKVKDVSGKAADKAKEVTAAGKEKYEDVKLSRKIHELCQEIGELVVAQRRGEAPADADAQIDAKVAEIADLERQIEENDSQNAANTADPTDSAPGAEATG